MADVNSGGDGTNLALINLDLKLQGKQLNNASMSLDELKRITADHNWAGVTLNASELGLDSVFKDDVNEIPGGVVYEFATSDKGHDTEVVLKKLNMHKFTTSLFSKANKCNHPERSSYHHSYSPFSMKLNPSGDRFQLFTADGKPLC